MAGRTDAVYLDHALDFIEGHAVRRDQVDWPALRAEAHATAAGPGGRRADHAAIRLVLDRLGDRHSFLQDPETAARAETGAQLGYGLIAAGGVVVQVMPGGPADEADVRAGDVIERIDGRAPTPADQVGGSLPGSRIRLDLRRGDRTVAVGLAATAHRAPLLPSARLLDGDVGHLDVPEHLGGEGEAAAVLGREYAAAAHDAIGAVAPDAIGGWVVDIRRDRGGNMWPMLAAVGPLLGDGECCGFVSPGATNHIAYADGAVTVDGALEFGIERAFATLHPRPPVAVLTSALTASSGEFVALAFRGRPGARSFGEPTYGVPSGNQVERLPDGALLFLTVCHGADRLGRAADGPLRPDEPVVVDWGSLGGPVDPVVSAPVGWLRGAARAPTL